MIPVGTVHMVRYLRWFIFLQIRWFNTCFSARLQEMQANQFVSQRFSFDNNECLQCGCIFLDYKFIQLDYIVDVYSVLHSIYLYACFV